MLLSIQYWYQGEQLLFALFTFALSPSYQGLIILLFYTCCVKLQRCFLHARNSPLSLTVGPLRKESINRYAPLKMQECLFLIYFLCCVT